MRTLELNEIEYVSGAVDWAGVWGSIAAIGVGIGAVGTGLYIGETGGTLAAYTFAILGGTIALPELLIAAGFAAIIAGGIALYYYCR
jgi:hypothetical protein